MRHKFFAIILVAALLAAVGCEVGKGPFEPSLAGTEDIGRQLSKCKLPTIFALRGTGEAAPIPDEFNKLLVGDEGEPFGCFPFDVVDPTTNQVIGEALWCIWALDLDAFPVDLAVREITKFTLPKGTLTTRISANLSFMLDGVDVDDGFTHLTGAEPVSGNQVVDGTEAFEEASGSVSSSGFTDLSMATGQFTIDAIYVIELD